MSKVQEVEETIGLLRRLGQFKSTITIIVLCFVVVFQQYKFSDRWTKAEHKAYVVEHDVGVNAILVREKAIADAKDNVLSVDMKEIKVEIKKMQRELGEIHATQNLILRQIKMNGSG